MSELNDDKLKCWLCGMTTVLTREHIPPQSAFNAEPLIVQRPSREAIKLGYIAWEDEAASKDGHFRNSLCERCNRLGGRVFVPSYSEFVQKVAAQAIKPVPLNRISIAGVRNRHLIFRQVLMQFVSANGFAFVKENPWISSFLLNRKRQALPPDVRVYLFATRYRALRSSGLTGHVKANVSGYRIVSEFTCWPLGTVLSFSDLSDEPLREITSWSEIPFGDKTSVDIDLPVNPVASHFPIDFRDYLDIWIDSNKIATASPDEDLITRMRKEVLRRGGETSKGRILVGGRGLARLRELDPS